jgi:hypothetical protein
MTQPMEQNVIDFAAFKAARPAERRLPFEADGLQPQRQLTTREIAHRERMIWHLRRHLASRGSVVR